MKSYIFRPHFSHWFFLCTWEIILLNGAEFIDGKDGMASAGCDCTSLRLVVPLVRQVVAVPGFIAIALWLIITFTVSQRILAKFNLNHSGYRMIFLLLIKIFGFWAWIISLNLMSFCFLHIVTSDRISLLLVLNSGLLCIYRLDCCYWFIHWWISILFPC